MKEKNYLSTLGKWFSIGERFFESLRSKNETFSTNIILKTNSLFLKVQVKRSSN